MQNPLEKTFNLPSDEDIADLEDFIKVDLPESATLQDIVRLSLEAYKMQLELIAKVEPKYRQRYFEVAQTYLENARDAIAKDKELQLRETKLTHDMAMDKAKEGENDEEQPMGGRVSREELLSNLTKASRELPSKH